MQWDMCYYCVCRLVDCEDDGMKYKEFCEFAMEHAGEMDHEQLILSANVMLDVIANRCTVDEDAYFSDKWLNRVESEIVKKVNK